MEDLKVLSKGEYLRPQDFEPVTLKRYLFVSDGDKKYILPEFCNNREETLHGLSFLLTQYDAAGNVLCRHACSQNLRAEAGETFVFGKCEAKNASREFHSVTGYYKGVRFTVLSTGIGSDNIDIVMNELDALANVDFKTREIKEKKRSLKILRIGTCGALQPDIKLGTPLFSHISIGFDGLLNWYSGRENVVMAEAEESFKRHMRWNAHLPDPYFVKVRPPSVL